MLTKTIAGSIGPNLLCIVPPYPAIIPPAGPAALLAYLRASGCDPFGFLDLRLWVPQASAVTYSSMGVFGESFVLDVPDLPLILSLLRSLESGRSFPDREDARLSAFCLQRGISPGYLFNYLDQLGNFFGEVFRQLPRLEFVGFSVWTSNLLTTLMAAAHLKRRNPETFIIAGGPHVTESLNSAELGLRSGLFDRVVLGEGEEALRRLYEAFRSEGPGTTAPVPRTMSLDRSGGLIHMPPQSGDLLRLHNLPLPAFDAMDLPAYQAGKHHRRILPLQLSRGCTDKCTFCSEWTFWEKFRADQVEHVLDQVQELQTRFRADGIAFTDSLLNGVPDRLCQFAEGLLSRGLKVRWGGFMRANMDRATAGLLKRSGCVLAFIGVESFSDETLELMRKRRTRADNLQALEAFLDAGIAVRAGFIPGFPGDDRNRFMETAQVYHKLQARYRGLLSLSIEPFTLTPGQPIFGEMMRYGLTSQAWDEKYIEIDPSYENITRRIPCTVTGSNQGMERLGQFQIAVALSQDSSNPTQTQRRSRSRDNIDLMGFTYSPDEAESIAELGIEHLSGDLYLATCKSPSALVYGCLLNHEEVSSFQNLWAKSQIHQPWSSSEPILERASVSDFLREVESRHIVNPRRLIPKLIVGQVTLTDEETSLVTTSPFLIARVASSPGATSLFAVNLASRQTAELPTSAVPLLRFLDESPRTKSEVDGFIAGLKLTRVSIAPEELFNQMKENGLLTMCPDGVNRSARVADLPQ